MAETPPTTSTSSGFGDSLGDVTLLLQRVRLGEVGAAEELLPLIYERLREVAAAHFASERSSHTLQPTALVHEAYIKLVRSPSLDFSDREHFCALAATAMRQILKDHAKAKSAKKRLAPGERLQLSQMETPVARTELDLADLDDALEYLGKVDEQGARLVELRFFGGLTIEACARLLEVSPRTADRIWRRSRALIQSRLDELGGAS